MNPRNLHVLVFADTPELAEAGRRAASDPRLARNRVEIQPGGIAAAAGWLAEHPSPDVLVVRDEADETVWDRLEALAENVEAHCRVVVAGRRDSIAIYREMVRHGLADYLGGALAGAELADCVCRLFAVEEGLPKGRLVTVIGAAGGVGTSTMAVVAAHALAARFGDCVLLDLDLALGTAALISGTDIRDPVAAALANPGVDAAMLERFMVRDGAVRLLSTAGSLRDARFLEADLVERLVAIARSMAKVVVVDLPRGWGEAHERLAAQADEVVLVTAPDLAALRNTRMMVEDVAARRGDGRKPRVVLNRAGMSKRSEYGAGDFAEAGGGAPAAIVPWDPEPLMAAIADGKPVVQAGGRAVPALRAFAATLMAQDGARAARPTKAAEGWRVWLGGLMAKTGKA